MSDDIESLSPEQAKAKEEIASTYGAAMGDPSHPLNKADHPLHGHSVERMKALFEQLHGTEPENRLGEPTGLAQLLEGVSQEDLDRAQKDRDDSLLPDAELKEEWGAAYNENLETARTAVQAVCHEFDAPELIDILEETGLGDHPAIIKLFHKIGEGLKKSE